MRGLRTHVDHGDEVRELVEQPERGGAAVALLGCGVDAAHGGVESDTRVRHHLADHLHSGAEDQSAIPGQGRGQGAGGGEEPKRSGRRAGGRG